MASSEKKHYRTALKLLDTTATGTSLANKFHELSIDSEDPDLKVGAKFVSDLVRPQISISDSKINVLNLANRLLHSNGPGHKQKGELILKWKKYCEGVVNSTMPEWQIIATKHGWAPKSGS